MTDDTCVLTTKDFTILEVMRERCLGRDDPLAPLLDRKMESARVVFSDDIPENVATLNSRVTFCAGAHDADTRILSHDHMQHAPVGMFFADQIPARAGPAGPERRSGIRFAWQQRR
ncbi:MAG: hypothetical protein H6892_00455 [Brucellaceae bacterium]|nr:hypothetical protein [Brucellaceae bacterium]